MSLELGRNHDIKIHRIALIVNNKGTCAWSLDPKDKFLTKVQNANFAHDSFITIPTFGRNFDL